MTSMRERRVMKELADIHSDKDNSGVLAEPVDPSDFKHLKGTFPGPPDTPYAGGMYTVDITIPDTYPFKAPVIKFDTKIFHPNVSSVTGAICLDTLGSSWSPVGTIKMALISLRMLLESPNPKDPQDAEVAQLALRNPKAYIKKAQEWAVKYAGAPKRELNLAKFEERLPRDRDAENTGRDRYQGYNKDLVDRFTNMGFDVDVVVDAFIKVGIERNNGEDYELEEAYIGDITAKLFGEP